jgi:protein-S-isoprenylcysteine O-methyltransferase Ste14
MNTYERIFGSGPRGVTISLALFTVAYLLEDRSGLPDITQSENLRHLGFSLASLITVVILIWSLKSLPPDERGQHLVTHGAFKYLRHPLYAAFLTSFDFGLALLLNNWIYLIWAILMHPIWHLNVKTEEAMLKREFGEEYLDYCSVTGRFFPRLF